MRHVLCGSLYGKIATAAIMTKCVRHQRILLEVLVCTRLLWVSVVMWLFSDYVAKK